jgi:16S rRNA (cytidine1402-2'-O)-methyltransferase
VATPIGNLGDISERALETLRAADAILCEDTRVTSKLLARYKIEKPLISYHSQSGEVKMEKILELLREGKNLALCSDAGTPAISDPGVILVAKVRSELPETNIVPIPGASAVTALLSVAGIPASSFLFLGFLPRKKGKQTIFKEIAQSERTVVFYESPHRIAATLEALVEVCGGERIVAIGRELTKIHEEIFRGLLADGLKRASANPRGEFVVAIAPKDFYLSSPISEVALDSDEAL